MIFRAWSLALQRPFGNQTIHNTADKEDTGDKEDQGDKEDKGDVNILHYPLLFNLRIVKYDMKYKIREN